MAIPENYNQTMNQLGSEVRQLFIRPEAQAAAAPEGWVTYRGAGEWPAEFIAERAEALGDTTRQAGELTVQVLETGAGSQQEAAEIKLLAQASAQLDVARELLQAAEDQLEEERRGPAAQDLATRSVRSYGLVQAIDELGVALELPLEVPAPLVMRSVADRPKDPEGARTDLETEVRLSLRQIRRQTARSGAIALRTLLKINPDSLVEGVKLISKEAAESLDKLIEDASRVIKRIVDSAVRLILQAYDWVLALLGKDVEAKARQKVKEWIDELKAEPEGDEDTLADTLVIRLYDPEGIRADAASWLKTTTRTPEQINVVAEDVAGIGNRYAEKTARVESFLNGIGVVRALPIPFVKVPQFQVVLAALTLGLLGYTLYNGYDHVDSGRVTFFKKFGVNIPDRVKGVRETVQEGLGAGETQAETPQSGE